VEGLYARIERWTEAGSGQTHWRSISRDNLTTVYGKDANSRIADPADPAGRVFSWLIAESFDAKGNAIVYHTPRRTTPTWISRPRTSATGRMRAARRIGI